MPKLDEEIDALFKAPLSDFVGARKALAVRLKQNGQANEAERVKALAKPSISAWTVNQLYWRRREEFDELIATGQRFRKAQTSGKMVNMREALDARSEALSHLSDLANETLSDAGHNPSVDVLRRIATTLEALSVATSLSDRQTLGRLTEDIDPPGFDSFGSFTPSAVITKRSAEGLRGTSSKKTVTPSSKAKEAATEASRREARQAQMNAAKASLQQARKSLTGARAAVKSLEGAQKKAESTAKEAAKYKREAEERFRKASAASTDAALRAQNMTSELTKANKALDDAKRAVETATEELESSFRESA
jgi:hypothetical protein